ncbi:MAG: 5'-nucleotidase C-terminal domain-containing protein [Bauldia sp.]|nr:5'-nucleotidase C-terminal domain-containing protein [Bauldia sp.]
MSRLLKAAFLATALSLPLAGNVLAEEVRITFVQTNDIDQMEGVGDRGGFAKLATVLDQARAAGPTIFVHSGDSISPSLLSGIDRGAHIIDFLNRLDLDVMVPGNHEFDFGAEVFRERIAEATFPIVATNVFEADGTHPANTVTDVWMEVEGIRIAFYGLTTEDTPVVSSPGDITFANSVDTGMAKAEELRAAGADIVVAVVHTPMAVDMALARAGAADLILSGHDEYLMAFFDGRVAVTESGAQSERVVTTTLVIDKTEANGATTVTWYPVFNIVDTLGVEPSAEIAAVVADYNAQLDEALGAVIGTTATAIDSRRAVVRGEEAAIGNLIADAMRASVEADVAITNGGGIRADREYAAGSALTGRDIFAELPFGNKTVKLELTGAQLREALENGFSQIEAGAGRFPQVSGLTVEVDRDAAPGARVLAITVGGEPVDDTRIYSVATNDFMAGGGDGYTVFVGAPHIITAIDAVLMASQVINYVELMGTISPAVEGRIVFR